MFYKFKSNIIYRDYGSFGYLTDNRNFGYKPANDDLNDIGDKIVSSSGAVFLSVLRDEPQELVDLSRKVATYFTDADFDTIKKDVKEFYDSLEKDGFIASGETEQLCEKNDFTFSYKNKEQKLSDEKCEVNKKCEDTQDFLENYYKGEPRLTNLHMEITGRCNEKCVHCYIPHEKKVADMSSDLFYNILEQCKDMKVLHITLSGGEPLLHENFVDFLQKSHEYNFSVNILTNLTELNESILTEMKKNKLLSVQTSLYSMDENVHDSITQKIGSFAKTQKAILDLIDNNIPLRISCPILIQNKESYQSVVEWGAKLNVKVTSDYLLIGEYDYTTQNLNNRLSICDIEKIMRRNSKRDPKYLESMQEEVKKNKQRKPDDYICSVCNSSICISERGLVYPCAGWQGCVLGDVNETLIQDIWSHSEKVKLLRGLRRSDFTECSNCPDEVYCTMCMARNANENSLGSPFVPNKFYCEVARLGKKLIMESNCGT